MHIKNLSQPTIAPESTENTQNAGASTSGSSQRSRSHSPIAHSGELTPRTGLNTGSNRHSVSSSTGHEGKEEGVRISVSSSIGFEGRTDSGRRISASSSRSGSGRAAVGSSMRHHSGELNFDRLSGKGKKIVSEEQLALSRIGSPVAEGSPQPLIPKTASSKKMLATILSGKFFGSPSTPKPQLSSLPESSAMASAPHVAIEMADVRADAAELATPLDVANIRAEEVVVTIPNRDAISAQLHDIFAPHINEGNHEAFALLINERANRLDEKGETPETIHQTLSKGRNMDRVAQATVGFVRSVPFGIASRLMDAKQVLTAAAKTPAQAGAIVGAFSGAADTVGAKMLEKSTSDTQWMKADAEQLEPVMAEAKGATGNLFKQALEISASFQTYTGRNILRNAVVPAVAKKAGAAAAAEVDSWIAAAGGPVAGAAAYAAMNAFNEKKHRVGPEYLLGRPDWEEHFDSLKHATWTDAGVNGLKRAGRLPVDVATDTLSGARELFTAKRILTNGVLTGGFAGVSAAKAAAGIAAKKAGMKPAMISAVQETVGTITSAPVFAAWTMTDVLADTAIGKAGEVANRLGNSIHQTNPPEGAGVEYHVIDMPEDNRL
ncbi:MAG: hypothetical protein ABI188_06380 [Collimonas sp.]|uniref:hypothetical protein n=1 Tax=Collimonas sp. TaxID=1963772 RepID=UPI0032674C10